MASKVKSYQDMTDVLLKDKPTQDMAVITKEFEAMVKYMKCLWNLN
jgi:hypothetical protein